ncbi:hypothetical protein FRC04_007807 [Tulasnella sp. 424]|nr:hypothetical protein FRC04_007807 [Tulasnella sp. 424]KAG8975283.1 hypothetical protein FRC05_006226 [Tulasnella sp. 425]
MGVTAMDVDQGTPETSQIPLVEGQTPVLPPVDPNALPSDASETVYIQNLNEKVKLENMKTSLRHLFKHYGNVLNVTAHKNLRMRGQAFVSFESKEIAAKAVKEVKGFPLYGKPMQLSFAKTRSDAVVEKFDEEHMDQHLVERKQRKKRTRRNNPIALRMKAKKQATQGQILNLFGVVRFPDITFNAATDGAAPSAAPKRPVVQMPDEYLPPNRVLFLQNLPAETITKEALQDLFGQYPNLIEIRTVPTKKDIAFVEYADEDSATKAKDALHNYKIDGEAKIKVGYGASFLGSRANTGFRQITYARK